MVYRWLWLLSRINWSETSSLNLKKWIRITSFICRNEIICIRFKHFLAYHYLSILKTWLGWSIYKFNLNYWKILAIVLYPSPSVHHGIIKNYNNLKNNAAQIIFFTTFLPVGALVGRRKRIRVADSAICRSSTNRAPSRGVLPSSPLSRLRLSLHHL